MSFGHRSGTAGLVSCTEVDSARDLQDLVDVNRVPRRDRTYHDADEVAIIESYHRARLEAQANRPGVLPRERIAIENLALARASRDQLRSLALSLPGQTVSNNDKDGLRNDLLPQAQIALSCVAAGLTVAFDLELGGFDTHSNHDNSHRQALMRLTNGITYLWDTAEALGLAGGAE